MLTLHLPARLTRGFSLARLLAAHPNLTWADGYRYLEQLELSGPERAFAQQLLRRKTNVWLYRCNQRAACGDFLVVDMSPRRASQRRPMVLELKQGGRLVLDAGGLQLARHAEAVAELVASGIVDGSLAPRLVRGSGEAILREVFGLRGWC